MKKRNKMLLAAGLLLGGFWFFSSEDEPNPSPPRDLLTGIWSRYEAGGEGSPIRFYYFHGNGIGLYRYGRVGYTNTNSFDYEIKGNELFLTFRKTGEKYQVSFRVEEDQKVSGRQWLVLKNDPREDGEGRYFRQTDEEVSQGVSAPGPLPGGRMWIEENRYATGGMGFSIYQFREAGIDGRGVGWFHEGDFDNWSTETLSYRIVGDQLELHFNRSFREEKWSTPFRLGEEKGKRTLTLTSDPRNFWHRRTLRDMGESFGLESFDRLALEKQNQAEE